MRRILAAVAVALLVGCGGSSDGVQEQAAPATAGAAAPAGVAPALQFTAPLVSGGQLDAGSLAGRPVVFWFWSPY